MINKTSLKIDSQLYEIEYSEEENETRHVVVANGILWTNLALSFIVELEEKLNECQKSKSLKTT